MNWLDIVILVIIAASTFMGLKNGLIKTILSFAGLILGIFLAGRFYVSLAKVLSFISDERLAQVFAFVLILIAVMLISAVLAAILTKIISAVMLGWVNHLGGAITGFVLGALFCAALMSLAVKFPGMSPTISGSSLAGILLDRFPAVLNLLPSEFEGIRKYFQ